VQCKHCQKHITHPLSIGKAGKGGTTKKSNTGTTSSLKRHLEGCQRYNLTTNRSKNEVMTQYFSAMPGKLAMPRVTKDNVLDKVLDFFISGNIAFNQADNHYFEGLVSLIKVNDEQVIVNRHNITKRLHDHAVNAKEDLMARLMSNDSKISISMDCWTSDNNIAFLGTISL
jgi:hypothetical protein